MAFTDRPELTRLEERLMMTWDREVDVLVAGSGAGGMTAALAAHDAGLSALVVEKAGFFGGSTAMSGGALWIPNNPALQRAGRVDDPAGVRAYLGAIAGDRVPATRVDAYLEHGPAAMEMLERISGHLRFSWVPLYPDYHPELPGGAVAGRTIEPLPIDARLLGQDEEFLRATAIPAPFGIWLTSAEVARLLMFRRTWSGRRMLAVIIWRITSNLVRRRHMKALGQALVVRLRLALQELGTELWLSSPVAELLADGDRVTGAVVLRDGQSVRIRARRAVILATGGFDHDTEMRSRYLPEGAVADVSAGAASNTGDGHRLGVGMGAAVDLMEEAWWMPSIRKPDGSVFPLVSERGIPAMVVINQEGDRFVNESCPYVSFVHSQLSGKHAPVYEIFDARAKGRYQCGGIMPGQRFPGSWYRSGLVTRAGSVAKLARLIGVPADRLVSTVERFNELARRGHDDDYGRGDSAYDRYYGDPALPHPNLDQLAAPPYYALRLEVGDLGTKGGLTCDQHGRVLRSDGTPIRRLYAVGNVSASVMGTGYAGAGATIGPAVVFAYAAIQDVR